MKPEQQSLDQETEILFPDQEITVAGEKVPIREFSIVESMQFGSSAAPLIEDLRKFSFEGDSMNVSGLEEIFARHKDVFTQMLSASTGKPVEWLGTVRGRQGRELLLKFWSVNRDFFLDRMMETQLNRLTGSVSQKSSAH
jgi:hypothetical protein